MISESNEEKWSSLIRAIHSSSLVARPKLISPAFSTSTSGVEKVCVEVVIRPMNLEQVR